MNELPPLRIREADGTPNLIPVFDIILSNNLGVIRRGGGIAALTVTTGGGGASNTASSGLTLTGTDLTVNTNVRDKSIGFFFAGVLTTAMLATSSMIYIPFNMELRSVQMAVSHSAGGQNVRIQPTLWNSTLQANTGLFALGNRPTIVTNSLVGSNGTLGFTSLHAGSFLGVQIDSVGTTVIASNLTVTFVLRTS